MTAEGKAVIGQLRAQVVTFEAKLAEAEQVSSCDALTQLRSRLWIAASGSAGLGTMQNGALEGSNVNISGEFSALIIAQRAFEANSKTITTFDTLTQETIQMIP
jgi:flagellar hook protein FlgE